MRVKQTFCLWCPGTLTLWVLLQEAARNRATARTNMNEHSSRSHSVLSVRLQPAGGSTPSVLHLVDLAGEQPDCWPGR